MSTKIKKPAARKPAAKQPTKERGNMKPGEIRPLAIAARKAFDFQRDQGIIDEDANFDTWRRTQCMSAVGKEGISCCNHIDFQPLLGHFKMLAGDDSGAFQALMQSGAPTDHADPGDDHELRRNLVFVIAATIDDHIALAALEVDALTDPAIAARKAAIAARPTGPITVGYIVFLARQKTRRPDLKLGADWKAGLAERCTVTQLTQIRDTLVNRISAVEGLGNPRERNAKQRSVKAKQARSPYDLDEPRW